MDEEALCRHGFAFDTEHRLLYMLCCYYDDAALSCYQLDKRYRKFTRKSRRQVGNGCPRGAGDQLGAAGICLRPNSKDIVAVFQLEHIDLSPSDQPQEAPSVTEPALLESARLCWLAVFSNRADTWIEVVSKVDADFWDWPGPFEPDQAVPPEDWRPFPIAIDEFHFAFASPTGKILLTDIQTGNSSCLRELHQAVEAMTWDAASASIQATLADGSRASIGVAAEYLQQTKAKAGPHKTIVRPHRPKRHQPPEVEPAEPAFPLSWSTARPIAITPEGRYAIAGRFVLQVPEQQSRCVLPPHGQNILGVAISRDGTWVFTNSGTIRMFDGHTGKLLLELGHAEAFALSPEETWLASAGHRHITVWDLTCGHALFELPGEGGNSLAWSPDGKTLAVGGAGSEIVPRPEGGFTVAGGRSVQLWDLEQRQCVAELCGHTECVCWLQWPSGTGTIVSAARDAIRVWDVARAECVQVIPRPDPFLVDLAVTPDGARILSVSHAGGQEASESKLVRIWDPSTGKEVAAIMAQPASGALPATIAVTNDSRLLIAFSGSLQLYDLDSGKPLGELGERWGHSLSGRALSDSGHWLVTRSLDSHRGEQVTDEQGTREKAIFDQTVRLWDLRSRRCAITFACKTADVLQHEMAVTNDGAMVAGYCDAQSIGVWDTATQTCLAQLSKPTQGLRTIVFSRDGSLLAASGYDKVVDVWDTRTGDQLASLTGHTGPVDCLAFSADGRLLSGSGDKSVRLWDWKDAQLLKTLRGHTGEITSVCMTGSRRQVISGSTDGTVRVWNSDTGRCEKILDGPPNWHCTRLLLTANDEHLVSQYQYEVWLWDIAAGVPLKAMKAIVQEIGVDENNDTLTAVHDCVVQKWSLSP